MHRILRLFLPAILMIGLTSAPAVVLAQHDDEGQTEQVHHDEHGTEHHESGHGEGDHGGGMDPLFFIIIALIIGAATRHTLRKWPIPFTVLLFLLGLGLGVLGRSGAFDGFHIGQTEFSLDFLKNSLDWAANIDPHLLLFVFLPILIFEAAFAMDVHTFKKTVVNATLLAVPGIVIALLLTGVIAIGLKAAGLGLNGWNWPIAFMFGSVVSATDPVAVVAILKELGASKKLGTLIEGESLLNDGTAIVFFMVFFLGMTGAAATGNPVLGFLYVALGGVGIGLLIGWLTMKWVKSVFNDALVEISIIIAAAYLTFYVAEHFLHVSGVLGLVSLGLVMAGPGRTSLSPEVQHFLHEFWELAVFIANILIFVIVGVVIAQRTVFGMEDFILLGAIYIGIFVVRAIVIAVLYPIMKRSGYGINFPFAVSAWWGALRGAIGLALALIVANAETIPEDVRNEFLFLTAGVVMLTLLINATTMAAVVRKLGITQIPAAKAAMISDTYSFLKAGTEKALADIKSDRFLKNANWSVVESYRPTYDYEGEEADAESTVAEIRRRILAKEKNSYWRQFKDGMLGGTAVRNLSDQIDSILDKGGNISLSDRQDLEETWQTPRLLTHLQGIPLLDKLTHSVFFDRLAVSYECARGFVAAQEEALKLLSGIQRGKGGEMSEIEEKELETIETEINENRIHGLTFLRNMRKTYPDIYNAIATRQAIRSMLNYEKATVDRLLKKGRIEKDEAGRLLSDIEHRMKRLMDKPPVVNLPDTVELLHEIKWLNGLESHVFSKVTAAFEERVIPAGETFLKEGHKDEGLFIIARGTVKISIHGTDIEILGPGSVVGEISSLAGIHDTASVTAESPVTALWIRDHKLQPILTESQPLRDRLWKIAGARLSRNTLFAAEPYKSQPHEQVLQLVKEGEVATPKDIADCSSKSHLLVLVNGTAVADDGTKLNAPALVDKFELATFSANALVYLMPLS